MTMLDHRESRDRRTSTDDYRPLPPGGGRLLLAAHPDLATHHRHLGLLPPLAQPARLLAEIDAAGLRGRGGAGFPTARKLAAVAAGRSPVVIANGAEGEPASAKDRTLWAHAPHLILDGLQLAGALVGARRAIGYVPAGPSTASLRRALADREAAGADPIPVEIVEAPDRFLAGEESAVVSRIEGKPALPRDTLRRVVVAGVDGHPTLVQNVETLAHLALLARFGGAWFRGVGTSGDPGTFLATVSGAVAAPGVYEVAYGIPLGDLLERAGGWVGRPQACLVGGYGGAWVPADAADVPVSTAGLRPFGAAPGAGVVVALPAGACGLRAAADITRYLAGQGARQCGPCRNGLPQMAGTLTRLADRERSPALVAELERLTRLVEGRGACHHPDGTVRLVRSTLRTFPAEIDRHLAGMCGQEPMPAAGGAR
jgi:NADH:ubiquinone oxidoreductase subunit F (NADH-binding)